MTANQLVKLLHARRQHPILTTELGGQICGELLELIAAVDAVASIEIVPQEQAP